MSIPLPISALVRAVVASALLVVYTASSVSANEADPYVWLEEIQGDKALDWVQAQNKTSQVKLGKHPLYDQIYADALDALTRTDKLPEITQRGDWIYYLSKSTEHPRGVLQRSPLADFKQGSPQWQTVLDIDALSAKENQNWVLQEMVCHAPDNKRCLVSLSPGGTDASELREFDLESMRFVKDGFTLPTAKMSASWVNADEIIVATNFGADSMTESGYPRTVKLWKRGTPLTSAMPLFTTPASSVSVAAQYFKHDTTPLMLITESLSFWSRRYYLHEGGKAIPLELPDLAAVEGVVDGELVVSLKRDWVYAGQHYKLGTVLLVPPHSVRSDSAVTKAKITVLMEPDATTVIDMVVVMDKTILITTLQNVQSQIYRFSRDGASWRQQKIDLPASGTITFAAGDKTSGEFFVRYEGFITPPTLLFIDDKLTVSTVRQQSATFNSEAMKVTQYFAESADGTKVPYFVVMRKDTKLNGTNPTLMFSYGGFRVSLTPSYSGSYEALNGVYGKAWLERGGVFVLANIRGGGEYGPAWHAAALQENKLRSYEDFEAVAEDLIKRGITRAKHLGIEGRSNGGLLVGATMLRRPDLYGAVICGVPLLDMKRYHTLLAGASWMAEYGDPDTADWEFIRAYSPYQNLRAKMDYPPVFFFTSTLDDRVHPGHARKMAAKMMAYGYEVDYYENTEGGHKGSATSDQLAKRIALAYTHLWQHLK
ncbi:prolyl oligopeptidase family serine peptidase [Arenicella chitinivorans]|nr:prolyl oligopeptidase family serine peptidase [Arenicella chitinivorans]